MPDVAQHLGAYSRAGLAGVELAGGDGAAAVGAHNSHAELRVGGHHNLHVEQAASRRGGRLRRGGALSLIYKHWMQMNNNGFDGQVAMLLDHNNTKSEARAKR